MTTGRLLMKAAMRSADMGRLAEQIQQLERGGIDALHFDVMDGRFVPEISFGPLFIQGLRKYTRVPFEVHLLVQEPDGCVTQYLDAGADLVLVHVEVSRDLPATFARIHAQGRQAGLAIAPGTPVHVLEPHLQACDWVNVMTVVPGAPGVLSEAGLQNLLDVTELIRRNRGVTTLVQVDGAVSSATRERFVEAGANALVAGYPIFSQADFGHAITGLRHPPHAAMKA